MKNDNLTMISMNLRRFRSLSGLNQSKLAEKAGISRNAYRTIETGKSAPRISNLHKIAVALDIKIQDLFREIPVVSSLRFRSNKKYSIKEENKREQHIVDFAYWLKDFNFLETELNSKTNFKLTELIGEKLKPVEMARVAREKIGLDDKEPINDICGLLEAAGLKIFTVESDINSFFGFSLSAQADGPAIGINISPASSVERKIFTAAHELGHILLHLDSFKSRKENESKSEEKEANEFASHFLMPQKAFNNELDECKGQYFVDMILHVKRIFKVSYKTIIYRLLEANRTDKYIWQKFYINYSKEYGEKLKNHKEPNPLPEKDFKEPKALDDIDFMKDRLNKLVREAFEKEIITMSRAAEILNINLMKIRDLTNSWKTVI